MDADERDEWLAYFAHVCPSCGNLRSVCSNPDIDWHPQEDVCWPTATREWGERRLRDEHKDFDPAARDRHGELLMSPLDGVSVWVSQFDLDAESGVQSDQEGQNPREDQSRDE